MTKRTANRTILTGWFLFSFLFSFAQQNIIYQNPLKDYEAALELFQHEKFGDAQKLFTKFLDETGEANSDLYQLQVIEARFYVAASAMELGNSDAENLFLNFVSRYEENPVTRRAYFRLGQLNYQHKHFEKAIEWFEQADVYGLDDEEYAEYCFQLGYSYFVKEKFAQAKPNFESIKDLKNKYYFPANYYYAYICYSDKSYEPALRSFKLIATSKLYSGVAPFYIAQIYFLEKKYDQVIAYAKPVMDTADLNFKADLQLLLGKAYFNKQKFEDALPLIESHLKSSGKGSRDDLYQAGYCNYAKKNYQAAIGYFTQLSSAGDSLAQNVLFLLADCYLQTGQKPNARNAFQESGKYSFDKSIREESQFNFAKLSCELGYQDVGISSLQDFIKNFPTSVHNNESKELLTDLFVQTNNFEDALTIIRSLKELSPKLKAAYQRVAYSRGVEQLNAKKKKEAYDLWEESLKNPVDASLRALATFWKGQLDYEWKRYDKSSKELAEYLELAKLKNDFPPDASPAVANYTMGYCNLKQENYSGAAAYFDNSKQMLQASAKSAAFKNVFDKLYPDILLRAGDCAFVLKNYPKAENNYQMVISNHLTGTDYALYQFGLLRGLQEDVLAKSTALQSVVSDYPNSVFADDALYELGNTCIAQTQLQNAADAYNKLIVNYPSSIWQKKAHLQLGLVYANAGNDEQAMQQYKFVATNYPKTPESKEALAAVKEFYIDKGDADGYMKFLQSVPDAQLTTAVEDSVSYLSAESKYIKTDCDGAKNGFTDYLVKFPAGAFALNAHYYRAECLMKDKDYAHALPDYNFVTAQSDSRFSERAFLQAARILFYFSKDYARALSNYTNLLRLASLKNNILEGVQGQMRCQWELKLFPDCISSCDKVLANESAEEEDLTEAHFLKAKACYENKQTQTAVSEFQIVKKATTTEKGAEAGYMLAQISFDQKNYQAAEDEALNIIDNMPSFDYWVAKSYILLARISFQQHDLFQARSTLQSIIDNYQGEDLKSEAEQLLKEVEAEEQRQTMLEQDSILNSNPIKLDSLPGILSNDSIPSNPK